MDKPTQTLKPLQTRTHFSMVGRGSLLFLVAGASGLLFACSYAPNIFTPSKRAEVFAVGRLSALARWKPLAHRKILNKPITLSEAMDRALKHHLERRITLQEEATSQKQLDLSRFALLPKISANAAPSLKNNSKAFLGPDSIEGAPALSTPYVPAQNQKKTATNLVTAWDMLDFGVRVMYARQVSDRMLVAKENRRKAVYSLLRDLRSAFWWAAASQKLGNAIGPVIREARGVLTDIRQVERNGLKSKLEALRSQRVLVGIIHQLQELRRQLRLAKAEFTSLIHLPAGSIFKLDIPDSPALIPPIRMTIEDMEQLALDNWSKVWEAMFTARVRRGDVREAMLQLLPGLKFQVSPDWDNNDFSSYVQWEEASARVIWHILDILQEPSDVRKTENKKSLVNGPRLTLHMAILTQVHLSFRQYLDHQRTLQAAKDIEAVDLRIFKNLSATSTWDVQSRLEYISSAASAITSRLQRYQAYADVQNAVDRVFVTILNPPSKEVVGHSDTEQAGRALDGFVEGRSAIAKTKNGGQERSVVSEHGVANLKKEPVMPAEEKPKIKSKSKPLKEKLRTESKPKPLKEKPKTKSNAIPSKISSPRVLEKELKSPATKGIFSKKNEDQTATTPVSWFSSKEGQGRVGPEIFKEIQNVLHAWAKAWSRRDADAYFSFYAGQTFLPPYGQRLEVWRQRTRNTFRALSFLQVDIDKLEVVREVFPIAMDDRIEAGGPTEFLRVSLKESYHSNHLQGTFQKLLVLGKATDGWKIYREALSETTQLGLENNQTSSGFAIQIASMRLPENVEKIRTQWLTFGIQPTVVETLDKKKNPRYSVRIAHFKEKDHALVFKWLLKLMKGVESMIVPASAVEVGMMPEADKTVLDHGNADAAPSPVSEDATWHQESMPQGKQAATVLLMERLPVVETVTRGGTGDLAHSCRDRYDQNKGEGGLVCSSCGEKDRFTSLFSPVERNLLNVLPMCSILDYDV